MNRRAFLATLVAATAAPWVGIRRIPWAGEIVAKQVPIPSVYFIDKSGIYSFTGAGEFTLLSDSVYEYKVARAIAEGSTGDLGH